MKRRPAPSIAIAVDRRTERNKAARRALPAVIAFVLLFLAASIDAYHIFIDFDDTIDGWQELTFPQIENRSEYSIARKDDRSVLSVRSDRSASGIIYQRTFNVHETPWLEWMWFAGNVIETGDARERDGDDYPIRLYIMFEYDPARVRLGERLQFAAARLIHGEYPPMASLNYIFNNRPHSERIIPNSFTERAQMFVMEAGPESVGMWKRHRVNMLEDYREAFGEEPPSRATVAVMGDTDNTSESASAYMDYIRISAD